VNDQYFFMHIPKCAGNTLVEALRRVFGAQSYYGMYHVLGTNVRTYRQLPRETRQRIRVLSAHRYLHQVREGFPHLGPDRRFTFVRNPIDRAVSYYFHIREAPLTERNQYMSGPHALFNEHPLEVFATGALHQSAHNCLTKYLCGVPVADPLNVRREHYELARKNLAEQFFFVGLTERFEESMQRLFQAMGRSAPQDVQPQNVTRSRPDLREISPKARKLLVRNNMHDLALYEYACELYEQRALCGV
jgi:hypothetical protein